MKKRKIKAIAFFVIALAAIFTYSYFTRNNSFVTVIINDEGFSPDTITVKKGTTVIWESGGEHSHWPASNPHPVHTLYPEGGGCIASLLDACRGLGKGEKYSFRFDAVGSWGVHDHLFPGFVMSVNVVDKLSLGKTGTEKSPGKIISPEDFKKLNYGEQLEMVKSMATADPSAAWAYIKDSFIINGQVVGNAHEFAHIIGNQAFVKFGLDGIKVCDAAFAFGCFHGVTEKMLLSEGLKDITLIEKGCLKIFPPEKSDDYASCIHGIGHGVYSFEEGDMGKALLDCDALAEPYRQYCYDGVFMENSFTPESRNIDENDPWKLCTSVNERYHRNCARYQSQIFFGSGTPKSVTSVGEKCALGPSPLLLETCFESLGYYIADRSLGKPDGITASCGDMPDKEGREICLMGAAKETIFQRYMNAGDVSYALCGAVTEPRRTECLFNIDKMIHSHDN